MVNALERAFADLIVSLQEIVRLVDPALLYRPAAGGSVGEQVLRSAAAIEQTFGGLTANLWDDPFEWTLPETLSTPALIIEYLSEVDASRERVFNAIDDDAALSKYVSVPSGESRPLIDPLIETLVRASDYRGRAVSHKKAQEGTKDFTA